MKKERKKKAVGRRGQKFDALSKSTVCNFMDTSVKIGQIATEITPNTLHHETLSYTRVSVGKSLNSHH